MNKRTFAKYIKSNGIDIKKFLLEADIYTLNKIKSWYINDSFIIEYLEILFGDIEVKENILYAYVNSQPYTNFDRERFYKYIEYRKVNKYDSTSDTFYLLKYGDMSDHYKKKMLDDKKSFYDPEYISKRENITLEEANQYITRFKKKKNTSLEGFISRHGEKDGIEKFKKFQETSKHTLDKYLEKYGEVYGNIKWEEFIKTKSETSAWNYKFWVNKYNYTEEEAKNKVSIISDTSSWLYFKNRYIDDTIANEKYLENIQKKFVTIYRASKESMIFFKPLLDLDLDIFIGYGDRTEYVLYTEDNNYYSYDFTIPSKKIIIEFHGYKYHTNIDKLTTEEWNNWTVLYTSITADDVYKKDQIKKKLAIDNGYKYLEIWSDDDKYENFSKIISFLQNNSINISYNDVYNNK